MARGRIESGGQVRQAPPCRCRTYLRTWALRLPGHRCGRRLAPRGSPSRRAHEADPCSFPWADPRIHQGVSSKPPAAPIRAWCSDTQFAASRSGDSGLPERPSPDSMWFASRGPAAPSRRLAGTGPEAGGRPPELLGRFLAAAQARLGLGLCSRAIGAWVASWPWGYRSVVHSIVRRRSSLMGWSGSSDLRCNPPRCEILQDHELPAAPGAGYRNWPVECPGCHFRSR